MSKATRQFAKWNPSIVNVQRGSPSLLSRESLPERWLEALLMKTESTALSTFRVVVELCWYDGLPGLSHDSDDVKRRR